LRRIIIENIFQEDDKLRGRPREKIPVAGMVFEGSRRVDESMITAGPVPAEKKLGGKVFGATDNTTGALVIWAEKDGSKTMLAYVGLTALSFFVPDTRCPVINS
jgi:Cu+-exporting ATPase